VRNKNGRRTGINSGDFDQVAETLAIGSRELFKNIEQESDVV
jgi:hypothetical protein